MNRLYIVGYAHSFTFLFAIIYTIAIINPPIKSLLIKPVQPSSGNGRGSGCALPIAIGIITWSGEPIGKVATTSIVALLSTNGKLVSTQKSPRKFDVSV